MSNEANLYLLSKLPAASLQDRYSPRTRTVAEQFAHMHNVRIRWMMHADPTLGASAKPLPKDGAPGKKELRDALRTSARIVTEFIEDCESAGKVKRWNGPPATFLAYLVAHEAHHRGLVMVTMRLAGRKLPKEVVYGQWQWGKQRNTR